MLLVIRLECVSCFYPSNLDIAVNSTAFFFDHESLTIDTTCEIIATHFETFKDLTDYVIYGGYSNSPCIPDDGGLTTNCRTINNPNPGGTKTHECNTANQAWIRVIKKQTNSLVRYDNPGEIDPYFRFANEPKFEFQNTRYESGCNNLYAIKMARPNVRSVSGNDMKFPDKFIMVSASCNGKDYIEILAIGTQSIQTVFKKIMPVSFQLAQDAQLYDFVYLSDKNSPTQTQSYVLVTTNNFKNKLAIMSEFDAAAGTWNLAQFNLQANAKAYSLVVMHSSLYVYAKDQSTSCTMIIVGELLFTTGQATTYMFGYFSKVSCPSLTNPTLSYVPAFLIAAPVDMSISASTKRDRLYAVEYKNNNQASDHLNFVWIDEDLNNPNLGNGCTQKVVTAQLKLPSFSHPIVIKPLSLEVNQDEISLTVMSIDEFPDQTKIDLGIMDYMMSITTFSAKAQLNEPDCVNTVTSISLDKYQWKKVDGLNPNYVLGNPCFYDTNTMLSCQNVYISRYYSLTNFYLVPNGQETDISNQIISTMPPIQEFKFKLDKENLERIQNNGISGIRSFPTFQINDAYDETKYTLALAAFGKSSFQSELTVVITGCGQESVTVYMYQTQDKQNFTTQALSTIAGSPVSYFLQSELEWNQIFISSQPTECPIVKFELYEIVGGVQRNYQSQQNFWLTEKSTPSLTKLNFLNIVPMRKYFALKGITTGGSYNFMYFGGEICGEEQVSEAASGNILISFQIGETKITTYTYDEIKALFINSNNNCSIESYQMVTKKTYNPLDQSVISYYTNDVIAKQITIGGDPTILLDTQVVFYLEVTTIGQKKGWKQVDMSYTLYCGTEKVTLVDQATIYFEFQTGTEASFEMKMEDFMKNFTVDISDCGITGLPEAYLNEQEKALPNWMKIRYVIQTDKIKIFNDVFQTQNLVLNTVLRVITNGRVKGYKNVQFTWIKNETAEGEAAGEANEEGAKEESQSIINYQPQFREDLEPFILMEEEQKQLYQSISAEDNERDKVFAQFQGIPDWLKLELQPESNSFRLKQKTDMKPDPGDFRITIILYDEVSKLPQSRYYLNVEVKSPETNQDQEDQEENQNSSSQTSPTLPKPTETIPVPATETEEVPFAAPIKNPTQLVEAETTDYAQESDSSSSQTESSSTSTSSSSFDASTFIPKYESYDLRTGEVMKKPELQIQATCDQKGIFVMTINQVLDFTQFSEWAEVQKNKRNHRNLNKFTNILKLNYMLDESRGDNLPSASDQFGVKVVDLVNRDQDSEIKFNLTFKDPLDVSTGSNNDQIQISFDNQVFRDSFPEVLKKLNNFDIEISPIHVPLPPQEAPVKELKQQTMVQSRSAAVMGNALVANVFVSFFMQGVLNQVYSVANTLQVITHYPLIGITFSSSTTEFYLLINFVVTFDIIPEDIQNWILNTLFVFPSDIPYNEKFNTMGYQVSYLLALLISPLVICLIGILKCFVHYLLSKCMKDKKSRKKHLDSAGHIYGFILRMFIELSLDISVLSMIEIIMRQTDTLWEKVSFTMSFIFIHLLVLGTIGSVILIRTNIFKIQNPAENPDFHKKYSVIWEDQKVFKHMPYYNIFFIIRRFVYAMLIVLPPLFGMTPIVQLGLIINLNLFSCCYNIHMQNFEIRKMNLIEIFNEICNLIISVYVLAMSQNTTGEQIFMTGLINNYFIIAMYVINLIFVLFGLVDQFSTNIRRRRILKDKKKIHLRSLTILQAIRFEATELSIEKPIFPKEQEKEELESSFESSVTESDINDENDMDDEGLEFDMDKDEDKFQIYQTNHQKQELVLEIIPEDEDDNESMDQVFNHPVQPVFKQPNAYKDKHHQEVIRNNLMLRDEMVKKRHLLRIKDLEGRMKHFGKK